MRLINIKIFNLIIIFLIILSVSGCRKNKTIIINNSDNNNVAKYDIIFSNTELDYISRIKERGYLRIATRNRATVFEPDKYGKDDHGGVEYRIAKSFADYIGVNLDITVVNNISEYFAKSGIQLGQELEDGLNNGIISPYNPDIIDRVDIIVDGLSAQRWRTKILLFIKTTPDKDMILARNDININAIEDLSGYRIAIVPAASYTTTLRRIESLIMADFNYIEVPDTADLVEAVSTGNADITCIGGIPAVMELKKYDNIKITIPVSSTDANWAHWAVRRDNEVLASILIKYITYAKQKGIYDSEWEKCFGVKYSDFVKLIREM